MDWMRQYTFYLGSLVLKLTYDASGEPEMHTNDYQFQWKC